MTKLREFRMKVGEVERHFYFEPALDLEDLYEDTAAGQDLAIKYVLETSMDTFGIVLEQDPGVVSFDVSIDYTIRGSTSLTFDIDPHEADERWLTDYVAEQYETVFDNAQEEIRYGNADFEFDEIRIEECRDERGDAVDLF